MLARLQGTRSEKAKAANTGGTRSVPLQCTRSKAVGRSVGRRSYIMLLPAALCALLAAAASSTSEGLMRTFLLATAGWMVVVAALRWRRRAFMRTLETAEDPHEMAFYLAFVEVGLGVIAINTHRCASHHRTQRRTRHRARHRTQHRTR